MSLNEKASSRAGWMAWFASVMIAGGLGCGRDVLVGSARMANLTPGSGGTAACSSGGDSGTGGTSGTGGNILGTGGAGTATVSCPTISTTPGTVNACGRTTEIAYSPDGQLIATATQTAPPNIHIWRLSDGTLVHDLAGHYGEQGSLSVAFSPDGTILATAGDAPVPYGCDSSAGVAIPGVVKLWDVATGNLLREIPAATGSYADTAQFSHDGARLVTGGAFKPVQTWKVADGTLLADIQANDTTYNARFSPDDTRIVTAGGQGGVWNAGNGASVFAIQGSEDVNDAAYSPDGSQIGATGPGGLLQFFNAASGQLLQSFVAHTVKYISRVVWVDANHVVSDDWGGNVKSWTRDATNQFVASGAWSLGAQTLGMAVSPDQTRIAVAGDAGFVFLAYPPSP